MSNYRFERLNDNNINDLPIIFRSAYNKGISIEKLKKKFNTSVFGNKNVGYIAYTDNSEPVAFYGIFPCYLEIDGQIIYAAQSGDTMTHKDHQGKGLFVALAKETYRLARELGIKVVFGFPNENSYPGFTKKLGWIHFDDIHAYLVRVRCIPWIRLKTTFMLPQQLHDFWFRLLVSLIKKGKAFRSSCMQHDVAVIDHSENFFNYKTYEENYLLNLSGFNVWLKHDDMFLYVGDIEYCSEKRFISILKKLKFIAFVTGLPHIRYHGSTNAWASKMFSTYGHKLDVTYPAGGVNFSHEVPLEKMQFTLADFDTF